MMPFHLRDCRACPFAWPVILLLTTVAAGLAATPAAPPAADHELREIDAGTPRLLTEPFLQNPGPDSIHVIWLTNFPGQAHEVLYGEGLAGRQVAATVKMERMLEDRNSRMLGESFDEVVSRPVYRHEAVVEGLATDVRTPYQVRSVTDDGEVLTSDAYTLQPTPSPGTPLRILLTSDQQNRLMSPANFQKVEETVGPVDAVFFSGDLVDHPRRASEWFDRFDPAWLNNPGNEGQPAYPATRPPFFPALQGTFQALFPEFPYQGGRILQNAALFASIGNHEVSGRYRPNAEIQLGNSVRTVDINSMYNDPQPRWYAELRYAELADEVNPSGDPAVREQWLRDNSYDFDVYRQLFTHPDDGPEGESYYAARFGDVFLISMNVSRIWRTWSVDANSRSKFIEIAAESNNPDEWGFGEFLFERFDEASAQYAWLREMLESPAARDAKYRVVMAHQGVFGIGDNSVPVLTDPVLHLEYVDDDGNELTRQVVLPADAEERRQVFREEVQPLLGAVTEVRYEYPIDQDIWLNAIEPLLQQNGVNLVHIGHSHLWTRSKVGALNYLETSNVGNSFGAYWEQPDGTLWRGASRASWASNFWNDLDSDNPRWNPDNYPRANDPHGLAPISPTLANPMGFDGESELPFVSSNNVTAFSILDTGTGYVHSYAFDTRDPSGPVVEFDRFPLTTSAESLLLSDFYQAALGRLADAGGLAFWEGEIQRLQALGIDLRDAFRIVAREFLTSTEYQDRNVNDAGFVNDLYRTFFNREPETAGFEFWTDRLATGVPRDSLLSEFAFSPEFESFLEARFGERAAREEVGVLAGFYRGFLNRPPEDTGFNYWLGRLQSAQCEGAEAVTAELAEISTAFIDSAEYRDRGRTNAEYVADLYDAMLGRAGDPDGERYWVAQLDDGVLERPALRRAFLQAPELQGRADRIVNEGCGVETAFTLQLLHFADVDGGGTAAMFNVDAFSALVDHFRSAMPDNTVVVSSGDNYIPGPIFQASSDPRMAAVVGNPGEGRGETAIQNRLGVQVSAVGNHDLDTAPTGFAGIIAPDGAWQGAMFPYLAANIDFTADAATAALLVEGGQDASAVPGSVAPSAVITVNGEHIGFVGAVTPTLPAITSVGNLTILPENFSEDAAGLDRLAAAIQPEVDALVASGIDKILLLSHMQRIDVERGLATRLRDVDIIVGGGSNTILADEGDLLREGDSVGGVYPELFTSLTGEPVLLVNTDADYKYLGRLLVDFDANGRIRTDRLDPAANGAWAAVPAVVEPLSAEPIAEVVEVADVLREILGELDGNAFGITQVFLDGRRSAVRSRETNLGNLTADANLWYAATLDPANPPVISVKNGGGIRAPIGRIVSPPGSISAEEVELLPPTGNDFGKPEGGISRLDIQTSLAFNNRLSMVDMTAAELRDLVEEMILGNFTHVGGLRVEFDPSLPARSGSDVNLGLATSGQRVRRLEVEVAPDLWDLVVEDGAIVGDPQRSFRVVALNFLADCAAPDDSEYFRPNCGSGWPFKDLAEPRFVTLQAGFEAFDPGLADFSETGGEQDALAEYLQAFHPDMARAYDVPVDINERLIPVAAD